MGGSGIEWGLLLGVALALATMGSNSATSCLSEVVKRNFSVLVGECGLDGNRDVSWSLAPGNYDCVSRFGSTMCA